MLHPCNIAERENFEFSHEVSSSRHPQRFVSVHERPEGRAPIEEQLTKPGEEPQMTRDMNRGMDILLGAFPVATDAIVDKRKLSWSGALEPIHESSGGQVLSNP